MHIHVLGAAPFGHLLAFHLRRHAQHNVTLFVRRDAVKDHLNLAGARLRVETDDSLTSEQDFLWEPWDPAVHALHAALFSQQHPGAAARARLPAPSSEAISSLIVTTKPTSAVSAVRHLQSRITPASTLVLLQEGMGMYDALVRDVFRNPHERPHFVLGSSSHNVWKRDPYHVVHHRMGGLKFGIVPDPHGRDFERSQDASVPYAQRTLRLDDIYAGAGDDTRYRSLRDTVAALLETEKLNTRWLPMAAMQRRLQRQCVVHSCVQPLAALNNCRVGALPKLVPARRLIQSVCKEASAVFAAQRKAEDPAASDSPTGSGLNTRLLFDEVIRYCERSAGIRPQMTFHFDGRVLTDVDFLNGYLQGLGRKHGVPTPTISALFQMVKLRHRLLLRAGTKDPLALPHLGQDSSE